MQLKSTTLPEKSYLQLLLKSCKISQACTTLLPPTYHLRRKSVQKRVVLPEENIVQEERVVLPVLALPNPVHTVPAAPQPILPPLPTIYPPPPGLAPLPDTDRPNSLMGPSISPPTVPAAPTRRSPREHVVRVPTSFGYS